MLSYLAFGASLLLVMVLVVADTKIGIPLGERVVLSAFWLVFAALFWWRVGYLEHDPEQMAWVGAVGYVTITLASLGRPVLIMWDALPGKARDDDSLRFRSRLATAVFLVVILAVVFIAEFR